MNKKVFTENRRAGFDYEFLHKYEAGLALLGGEVKSIQTGKANISGAIVLIRGGRPYLINADIPAYQPKNQKDYDPSRARPLLLNKKEIAEIQRFSEEQKLTIVPISLYNANHLIKLEFGVGRKKKKSDKRESIKKKEVARQIKRAVR